MSGGNEIPPALIFAKVKMGSQNALATIQAPLRVFDMNVVDTAGKFLNKGGGIEKLRDKMARVKVNAKARATADSSERFARRHIIVGNFGGMYFQAKLHAFPIKYVYNRIPAPCEFLVPLLDLRKVVWWEGVEEVPDR